jgi:hypothetical protein
MRKRERVSGRLCSGAILKRGKTGERSPARLLNARIGELRGAAWGVWLVDNISEKQ